MEEEINILDYLRVIKKHLRMILVLFVFALILTMVISLLSPKIYRSTATILLPQEILIRSKDLIPLLGSSRILEGLVPVQFLETFVALLKSRTMKDDVINRFKLLELYKVDTMTAARNILEDMTEITASKKDGTISISVESKDPKLSSDIANFYVDNLDRLNRRLNITQAKRTRLFIEDRLKETEQALKRAEEALKRFRSEHKLVEIGVQSQAAIEAAAQIQGEITAKEVRLKVMEEQATSFHPEVAQLKTEIRELKKRLHNMEYGKGLANPQKQLYIPFTKVPSVSLQLARLMREVKLQETVFTLLTEQYEQAKIAEARDTPTVQVLDRAIPAEHNCKPNVKFNMAISGVISLFIGIFLAFFLEYLQGLRRKEERKNEVLVTGK